MDKNVPVTDDLIKQFAKDVNQFDGDAAGKILDEVGSCGWSTLVDGSQSQLSYNLALDVDRTNADKTVASIIIFVGGAAQLAKVVDKPCDQK